MKTWCYSCYVKIIRVQFEKATNLPNEAVVLCNICQISHDSHELEIAAKQP